MGDTKAETGAGGRHLEEANLVNQQLVRKLTRDQGHGGGYSQGRNVGIVRK